MPAIRATASFNFSYLWRDVIEVNVKNLDTKNA
jgi:hypothetical protein